jgi:autoinducer 2 (AI-2) kinase
VVVAAIDAGTTGVRCMIVDKEGKVQALSRRNWGYSTPPNLEIAMEFDAEVFWNLIRDVVNESVQFSGLAPSDIAAASTTSQRHGVVFLDADGNELYCGPNVDARGALTQYIIEEALGDRFFEITGCWPPLMFAPARLAWFEEEAPEIHERVAHILPINDWITFRLSGVCVTEPSSASSTGFLDIRTRDWSDEVVSTVGIDKSVLPTIVQAGDRVGELQDGLDIRLQTGLPIIQGGADTQCAILASQGTVGDVVVIAGSTTPVMRILDSPKLDDTQRIWSGCHLLPDMWILESNATMTGANFEWALNLLCERAENPAACRDKILANLESLLVGIPPGSYETMIGVGPCVMDCQQITEIRQARIIFPQPALPQVKPLDSATLLHAIMENIAFAVKGNHAQLGDMASSQVVKTIGGMTKSSVFPEILSNVLDLKIKCPQESEGSLLGAAICAAKGAGDYTSLQEAAATMVKWHPPITPDKRADLYESYYARWNDVWTKGEI